MSKNYEITAHTPRRHTVSNLAAAILSAATVFSLSTQASVPQKKDIELRVEKMPRELRKAYASLQYVLAADEFKEFWALYSDDARERWIAEYWKTKDPNYTTVRNETLALHNSRVAYAESVFFAPRWPGWDQRGELVIRYGLPYSRSLIQAETTINGLLRPAELWYYPQHDMYARLEDAYVSGYYTITLGSVDGPPSIRQKKIGRPIDAKINVLGDVPEQASTEAMHQYEQFKKKMNNFTAFLEERPAAYPFEFSSGRVPFCYGVDLFRGGEAVDRVEVNVEFPASIVGGGGVEVGATYVTTAVFWDTDRKEVGRKQQKIDFSAVSAVRDTSVLMPSQLLFSLPPDFYHMAVTVEEQHSGRFSSYRSPVTCEDFDRGLALSSVLFARRIAETVRQSPFNRGPLQVIPHPGKTYDKTTAVPIYFEVYNLKTDQRGFSSYVVEYRIVQRTSQERGLWEVLTGDFASVDVSSTFRASSQGPHDTVHLAVRVDNLDAGEYDFQVTVTDELTQDRVSRGTNFFIVE